MFIHRRFGGYECSSKGDKRFSALFARMPDGRTIEEHYQCDIKGYQPNGTNWRLGKGKPPLNTGIDLFTEYKELWRTWAKNNIQLILVLYFKAKEHNNILSDCFASDKPNTVSQSRALAELLTEWEDEIETYLGINKVKS